MPNQSNRGKRKWRKLKSQNWRRLKSQIAAENFSKRTRRGSGGAPGAAGNTTVVDQAHHSGAIAYCAVEIHTSARLGSLVKEGVGRTVKRIGRDRPTRSTKAREKHINDPHDVSQNIQSDAQHGEGKKVGRFRAFFEVKRHPESDAAAKRATREGKHLSRGQQS